MRESEGTELDEPRVRAVRLELNRLLESAAFRTSKRCREFLEYIVEHTLSGPSGILKERSIGVELFQLPSNFDTGQHTIVRVTANEVRKKLAQQYLAENGSPPPVRIDLPPGSYSAEFRWESSAAAEHVPARLSWLTRPAIACGAAILALAGAFSLWRGYAVKPIAASTKSSLNFHAEA